jgi:hypothetical protein
MGYEPNNQQNLLNFYLPKATSAMYTISLQLFWTSSEICCKWNIRAHQLMFSYLRKGPVWLQLASRMHHEPASNTLNERNFGLFKELYQNVNT